MATIRKRGDSYEICASAGYDSNHRQIRKYKTWIPTEKLTPRQLEKELARIASEFERSVQTGQCIDANTTFAQYAELWLKRRAEDGENPCAPNTFAGYSHTIARILPAIGHIKMADLRPQHIKELLANLKEGGVRGDTTFKPLIDLRAVMKEKAITQAALSKQTGVALDALRVMANGRSVSRKTAEAVCKSLGMKMLEAFEPVGATILSNTTVLRHFRILSAVLQSAVVEDNILQVNPAKNVKAPRKANSEGLCLDEVQSAKLLEHLDTEPPQYRAAVRLLLFTGLRRGELLGLTWGDISFNDNLLSVRRSAQYLPGKGIYTKETKNESSTRVIKLPSIAIDTLRDLKLWQNEHRLSIGDLWNDNDLLFTQWDGKPMHPNGLTGWFGGFIKKHPDLPQIHLHSLRHTNATLLIAAGQNIRTVSKRLGHSKTSTTSDIYSHAIASADAKAAEVLDDLLNPIKAQ